ncbi:hypothetical protein IC229_08930 [Spirosoma sp. BT702]|uniref:Uncharacterized protein n=1 Tax=Spirosoma profusum TaxID=2771354 RepID=A0A926XUK6_9BACT|nr:hypothetical protein [Spirosoma profusum]MBD2700759.1 hypothetical protein [Spirosoma profusum]
MSNPIVISKAKPVTKSQDYALLVQEGLACIRQWAGDSWTDHNVHDPGITLLETLSYALTELGYRGQIDIAQLLDKRLSPDSMALYAPEKSLVCEAITAEDFQKLLITLPEVKYAQVKPAANVAINGLYDVLVEWEDGDLNDSLVSDVVTANGRSFTVEFAFPYWDEPSVTAWSLPVVLNQIAGVGQPLPQLIPFEEDELNDYFTNVDVTFATNQTTRLTIVIRLASQPNVADRSALEQAIVARLTQVSAGSPVETYRSRVATVFGQMNAVKTLLASHRNLSEEFIGFKSVRTQEIALRASVELSIEADAQQTLIEMLSAIDLFIDPVIRFSNLVDLLADGLPIESIFDGPLLSAGFLRTFESSTQTQLYASDLLRQMLQTSTGQRNNDVIAVENFSMSSYVRNRLTTRNAINSLTLLTDEQFQPRLSVLKSEITFFRNGAEISYDSQQVVQGVLARRKQAFASSTAPVVQPALPPVSAAGWNPETIADYHSIQYDLPLIYGLQAGVPDSATPLRKAQEKQLRGFLLVFEQLLANHLSQLANTSGFFNFEAETPNTYFFQPLYDSPHIDQLLRAFPVSGNSDDWYTFRGDQSNAYLQRLRTSAESPPEMLRRKHRVLDHLLGRFSEELLELSRLEYTLSQQEATSLEAMERIRLATSRRLLRYKAAFLRDLCESQAGRATGLSKQSVTTLSGLERSVYRKAGITRNERQPQIRPFSDFFEIQNSGVNLENYRLKDAANVVLLTSVQSFPTVPARTVFDGIRTAIRFGVDPSYYQLEQTGAAQWRVNLIDDSGIVLARSATTFTRQADAGIFIQTTSTFLYATYSNEGFYLIEHVLLRPQKAGDTKFGTLDDPYSFQITLVFPSGYEHDFNVANALPTPGLPHRFRQKDFRNYVEAVVQQECPAHIVPTIVWLDVNTNPAALNALSFDALETFYRTWYGHFLADTLNTTAGTRARNQLVKFLTSLYSTLA